MPDGALRRTPENDLLLDFYNVNEIRRVVVPEDQRMLRIENMR